MDLLSSPHLAAVSYILNFRKPDLKIRFRQGEVEAAFSGFINGQSQQTNTPDNADPTQPRIVFSAGPKSVLVSQVTCHLQLNFEKSTHNLEQQLDIARKNVREFAERAKGFLHPADIQMSGLVYDITYPSTANTDALQDHFYKTFYARPQLGKIASAQINVGFHFKELFLNISGSIYENRKMDTLMLGAAPGEVKVFDISTIPVIEHGIAVKVDINDRPRNGQGGQITSADELIATGDDFFANHYMAFTGFPLKA